MFGLGRDTAVSRQDADGASATLAGTAPGGGLAEGTLIATAIGWRPAEAIAPGDLVLTFDRGLQPVRQVRRQIAPARDLPRALWPLLVPAGAIGNGAAMVLWPEQPVMMESDAAEMVWGDPFTLIDAADLDGFRGTHRIAPKFPALTVTLEFERDEVVFAQQGALVYCGRGGVIALDEVMAGGTPAYRSVDAETARELLASIEHDAAPVAAFTPAAAETPAYAAFA